METSRSRSYDYSGEINEIKETNAAGSKKKTGKNVVTVGLKTAVGAGVGVVTGVFGAIFAAHVLEIVVPALLLTKTAGVVGGATGMLKGIKDIDKK